MGLSRWLPGKEQQCSTYGPRQMHPLTRFVLLLPTLVVAIMMLQSVGAVLSVDSRAPILAHPLYPVQVDKRFGIAIQPGLEIYTGDIITLSVETGTILDGDDTSITSVLQSTIPLNNGPSIVVCTPPALVDLVEATEDSKKKGPPPPKQGDDFAIAYHLPADVYSPTYDSTVQRVQAQLASSVKQPVAPTAPIYGPPPPFVPGPPPAASSVLNPYAPSRPTPWGGPTSSTPKRVWVPSIYNMFVVSIVDGRLGWLNLSPLITYPRSAKYLGALRNRMRSGLASVVGNPSGIAEDEIVGSATLVVPDSPFEIAVVEHLLQFGEPVFERKRGKGGYGNNLGNGDVGVTSVSEFRVALRPSLRHQFARCEAGIYTALRTGREEPLLPLGANLDPPTFLRVDRIPASVVRHLLDIYQALILRDLPRPFFLLSMLPFVSRTDGIHFLGADAELTSDKLTLARLRAQARGTRIEQQVTLSLRSRASDNVRFSVDAGLQLELNLALEEIPLFPGLGALSVPSSIIFGEAIDFPLLPPSPVSLDPEESPVLLLDAGGLLAIDFGKDIDMGTAVDFGGDYTVMCPANTDTVGHVVQHIGRTSIPFIIDIVRQEHNWAAQWIGDMQIVGIFGSDRDFIDPCATSVPRPDFPGWAEAWTIRMSAEINHDFDVYNPFSFVHPSMELHHFAVTGRLATAITTNIELIVERTDG